MRKGSMMVLTGMDGPPGTIRDITLHASGEWDSGCDSSHEAMCVQSQRYGQVIGRLRLPLHRITRSGPHPSNITKGGAASSLLLLVQLTPVVVVAVAVVIAVA